MTIPYRLLSYGLRQAPLVCHAPWIMHNARNPQSCILTQLL